MVELLGRFGRRLLMLVIGWCFVGLEAYGTFEFLSEKHGRWAFMTLAGVAIAGLGAGLLPMVAEDARRNNQRGLKWAARCAVPLVLIFVFIASIQRTTSTASQDEAAIKQRAQLVGLARKEESEALSQLVTDQTLVKSNCDVIGPKCTKAMEARERTNAKLDRARADIRKHGAGSNYLLSETLARYLPFLTKDQVDLFMPLLQPMCLAILGTIFLSSAYNNGKPPMPASPRKAFGWRLWPRRQPPIQQEATPKSLEIGASVAKGLMQTTAPTAREPASAVLPPKAPAAKPSLPDRPRPKLAIATKQPIGAVYDFLREELKIVAGSRTSMANAFISYTAWCKARSLRPLELAEFVEEMEMLCQQCDIRIRPEGDRDYLVDVSLAA